MEGDDNYERNRIFSMETKTPSEVEWNFNEPGLVTISSESLVFNTEYIHVFTRNYMTNTTKSYLYFANLTYIDDVSADSTFAAILEQAGGYIYYGAKTEGETVYESFEGVITDSRFYPNLYFSSIADVSPHLCNKGQYKNSFGKCVNC